MLDLTYLFPDEPLEEDDLIILPELPHWLFKRELALVMANLGAIWPGEYTVRHWPEDLNIISEVYFGAKTLISFQKYILEPDYL